MNEFNNADPTYITKTAVSHFIEDQMSEAETP